MPAPARAATRLVLDARSLADASSYRGIGTYTRHLLAGLAGCAGLEVTALVAKGTPVPAGIRARPVLRLAPGRWADAEHDLLLPLDLARARAEVFHSPAQDPPRRSPGPWAQTLHGLAPLAMTGPGSAAERRRWDRRAPRLARAGAVIAVSRWCADQAVSRLGVDARRVHVAHHGVDPAFRPGPPAATADPPYLLTVGELGPTKGYAEAFAAVGLLAEAGYPHRLRVAGRVAPWVAGQVRELLAAAPRPDRVDLVGHLDHLAELPELYRGASALLVTSRYESFCLPAVEAMASGIPVVAFANTALPEIVGHGGLLVPDGDVPAMVRALRSSVLDSPDAARELAGRGLRRARDFDWAASVAVHAEVYRALAA